jgi:hypothetical protein
MLQRKKSTERGERLMDAQILLILDVKEPDQLLMH